VSSDKNNGNDSRKNDNGGKNSHPWSVAFPDWLREMVDDTADQQDMSRSRWMREAATEQLKRLGIIKDNEPPAE
jgi:hypothetical protein